MNWRLSDSQTNITAEDLFRFEHLNIRILNLPFDLAQGGESIDVAQDREPVVRLVEPFRISRFDIRILCWG
jgi:hypothetical protein